MWTSFYQVVVCNGPIFYPIQTTQMIPFTFPIVQTVSTIPNEINIQSNEQQGQQIHYDSASVGEEQGLKEQFDFTGELPANSYKELLKIMELVLSKIDSDPKLLEEEIFQQFYLAKTVGKQFFTTLISKLKKLSKTKQELIKYCMRKAFKFIHEKMREEMSKIPEDDILRQFIKGFNEKNQNIPFKKNSHFKTMNTHFLTQLFQSPTFNQLYEQFLQIFPKICEADNNKKVEHLAKMMLSHIKSKSKDLKRFNNFKRIPWTQSILSRCLEIAQDLKKYASISTKWGISLTDK